MSTLGLDLIWAMSGSESSFQRFIEAMTGFTTSPVRCSTASAAA